MGVLANLLIRIGANTTDYDRKLSTATGRIKRFGSDLSTIGRSLTFGISAPLAGVGFAALKVAGDMESAQIAFTTMTKSSDVATKHLKELRDFAVSTPFQFGELVDASRLMQAYGFRIDEVVPKLRIMGNAVSALGGGRDLLERVVRSIGEIGTRGKVTGEQLRELSRAGIPALEAIATKLGVSMNEAQKRITAGAVDAKTAMDALLGYMQGRFAGGMEAQSRGLLGMWSNIKDKITFTLADIGKVLAPTAKSIITDYLDPMLKKVSDLAKGFSELSPAAQKASLGIGAFALALPPIIWATGATITNLGAIAGAVTRVAGALSKPKGVLALLAGPAGIAAGVGAGVFYVLDKLNEHANPNDTSVQTLKNINAELSKNGELVAKLTHGTVEHGAAVKSTESGREKLLQFMIGLGPATKAGSDAIDDQRPRLVSWAEIINREIGERGEAAMRKTVSALADVVEAGKPWGKQLELQAAQIDDTAFRTQLLRGEIERLGQVQAGVAEIDWAKKIQGSWMEAAAIMKSVGVTPQVDLRQQADKLAAALNAVRQARDLGRATDNDVARTYAAWAEADARAKNVAGNIAGAANDSWRELGRQISTIKTDMSRGITDLIFQGGKLKDVLTGVAQQAGKAVVRYFIEGGINKAVKALGGLMGSLGEVGKAITSVFSTTSSVVSGAGNAAAGAASGATGAAGAAASAIGAGLSGWVGAIGSAVNAVFSGLSYFQGRRMEQDVGRIEVTTRGILNQSISIQGTLNQWLPYFQGIQNRFDDTLSILRSGLTMTAAPVPALAGGELNMTISGNTFVGKDPSVVDWIADEVVRRLRNAGLKF